MAKRGRRDLTFWLGLGLVAVGLGLLGYVGWQYFGTNIVSERRQQEVIRDLEREWRETDPVTMEGKDPEPTRVRLGEASALIRIPRFGADYVMPVLEGVGDDALARGFGHFAESADPGEKGNYALAGHRVTHGEPLRDMPELRPGDQVIVETRQQIFTYELVTDPEDLVVTFQDVWVIAPDPENPDPAGVQPPDHRRLITLTTCAELFHTDDRMIAFGHLVSSQEKERA